MSFAGIVVWNAKYGVPCNHRDAWNMEDDIKEYPFDKNDQSLLNLLKDIEKFAKQALKYFDDETLVMYSDFTQYFNEEEYSSPVLDFSEVPQDLMMEFSAIIVKSAKENNLIVRHDELETLFLPNGQIYLDDTLVNLHTDDFIAENMAMWRQKIKALDNVQDKDEQELFSDESLFRKYTNTLFKQQIKKRKLKAKKLSNTAYVFNTERMQVVLSIYPRRIEYKESEQKYTPEVSGYMTIFINDISDHHIEKHIGKQSFFLPYIKKIQISYDTFFKTPKALDGTRVSSKTISSKAEYEAYVEQNFDMLVYMLEHCQNLKDFYTLYDNCEHNEHLRPDEPSTPVWKGGVGYQTLTMLYLAYLTQQADYLQRREQYRQEYLQYAKECVEADLEYHQSQKNKGYSVLPLIPFEEQFAVYINMFEELVTLIENLDVEAILSAPPKRWDIEYLKYNW